MQDRSEIQGTLRLLHHLAWHTVGIDHGRLNGKIGWGYIFKAIDIDALVKSPKSPFDKLRANGGLVEIIAFFPFVVSLSNHTKDFLRLHQ